MKKRANLNREQLFQSYERQPLDKVLPLLKPYRGLFAGSVISLILFNMIGLTMPWMMKISIDRILPNADYLLYWILCGSMLLIYLCRALLRYISVRIGKCPDHCNQPDEVLPWYG